MKGIKELFCHASFSDILFTKKVNEPIADFENIPALAMAEEKFNADSSLIFRTGSWHCWFYDPGLDWNLFDTNSIKLEVDNFVALKTINKFIEIDDTDIQNPKRTIKSVSIDNPSIYLFLLGASNFENNWNLEKEIYRLPLKINWIK